MPGVEPKVARWDYHSVHINLLYLLSTIDIGEIKEDLQHLGKKDVSIVEEESVLLSIAERWLGYMLGKRAGHN
jgi:tetrahydromethanopterin S-methyltransferase subunit A